MFPDLQRTCRGTFGHNKNTEEDYHIRNIDFNISAIEAQQIIGGFIDSAFEYSLFKETKLEVGKALQFLIYLSEMGNIGTNTRQFMSWALRVFK